MKTKSHLQVFLLGLGLLICLQESMAQQAFKKLIWSEEFNYTGVPDPSKWTYDTAMGCPANCGWGNNELQYYTNRKENAWVQNGILTIKAQQEKYANAAYTSARLHTRKKFEFTYGKVEARAKLPVGIGTWPAIWMLGHNISDAGWPACGEIDIMEHRGYEMNKVFGTFHYPGHSGDNADGKTLTSQNVDSEFHIYSAEWGPDEIRLFTDGQLIHSLKNTKELPYHQPFFLLLNLAIGGYFGGPVDPKFERAQFQIDYVRVYQ